LDIPVESRSNTPLASSASQDRSGVVVDRLLDQAISDSHQTAQSVRYGRELGRDTDAAGGKDLLESSRG
jgi:hypothetical protein